MRIKLFLEKWAKKDSTINYKEFERDTVEMVSEYEERTRVQTTQFHRSEGLEK